MSLFFFFKEKKTSLLNAVYFRQKITCSIGKMSLFKNHANWEK